MGAPMCHMNFLQAIAIGALQGISELFPISSLGNTVIVPSWLSGSWALLVCQETQTHSPYLAFVVGLHLATAVVLLGFYAREWGRLIAGFFRSLVHRRSADVALCGGICFTLLQDSNLGPLRRLFGYHRSGFGDSLRDLLRFRGLPPRRYYESLSVAVSRPSP